MSVGSNPFPFLLWIATLSNGGGVICNFVVTLFHFYCGLRRLENDFRLVMFSSGSNPFPFLLWIATDARTILEPSVLFCSNPFPFLLWIATLQYDLGNFFLYLVVTLFHFYCGLRHGVVILKSFLLM